MVWVSFWKAVELRADEDENAMLLPLPGRGRKTCMVRSVASLPSVALGRSGLTNLTVSYRSCTVSLAVAAWMDTREWSVQQIRVS